LPECDQEAFEVFWSLISCGFFPDIFAGAFFERSGRLCSTAMLKEETAGGSVVYRSVSFFIGALLIVLGAGIFVFSFLGLEFAALLVFAGLGFAVAWWHWRFYGFLVPGAVLVGLGCGFGFYLNTDYGIKAISLGTGVGLFLLWGVSIWTSGANMWNWWPLLPGVLLVFLGLVDSGFSRWWPLLVVLAGVAVLLSRRRRIGNFDDWDILR